MRKILLLITIFTLICGLAIHVNAATGAKSANSYATVSADGSCQMVLTVAVHLDQPVANFRFPLPENASNITVNGARARSRVEDGLRLVDLSGIIGNTAGDFTLTFTYSLPNLVAENKSGFLELQLPLLSGFAYPIEKFEFSVTLPGPISAKPAFTSGYHQANIEKDIYCTVFDATINGIAQTELKDHETLSMKLLVDHALFPQSRIAPPDFHTINTLILIFSLLALAYWIIFLRNIPPFPTTRTTPPDGYTAGELSGILHLHGGDLSMMIFSWAQLGYLLIRLTPGGKVLLTRQMDMGNERSFFEQRCFQQLFDRHNQVDTGSTRFQEACRNVQKMRSHITDLVHRKSGNLFVFRGLFAIAGLFFGASMGLALRANAVVQWLVMILLGAIALFSSWYIQGWMTTIFTPKRRRLWIALALCSGWLLLSFLIGPPSAGLGLVFSQLFAGLLLAFGGRRTTAGRQAISETLGLWRYFRTVPQEQLRYICQKNPEYFHQMAPYALALGADKRFAKQFGKLPIGPCPYISIGTASTMYAGQWSGLMRRVLRSMNAQQRKSILEKLFALIR